MDLLTAPFEAERRREAPGLWMPLLGTGAALVGVAGLGRWLEWQGGLGVPVGLALGGAGVHGGFIAIGWLVALDGRSGWRRPAAATALAAAAGFALSRLGPWGALGYLVVPLVLLREARRHPEVSRIGWLWPLRRDALGAGAAAGAFLGVHLLVTASLTFGYPVRLGRLPEVVQAVAYDVGVNAVSAEWLFRGALFSHWWRHLTFWGAAGLSTSMAVARYLLDPNLPATVEVGAGAVFYLTLLGLAASGLRAWSGSLLPGYLATVLFFAAYRLLAA
jgi:hypothetical protein